MPLDTHAAVPPSAAAGVPAGAAPPATDQWRLATAEALGGIPIIGKFLKYLITNRFWSPLLLVAALLWFFVVYPLLVPYLAAQMINRGILLGGRDDYADVVRTAFKVREAADEVTTESYKRLDYFFLIEFSRRAKDGKTYEFPLAQLQKLELRIAPGRLTSSDTDRCGIPPAFLGEEVNLMDVSLNGKHVAFVQNLGEQKVIKLTRDTWAGLKDLGANGSAQLSFQPVQELRTACDQLQIDVKASLEVYKDLFKEKS